MSTLSGQEKKVSPGKRLKHESLLIRGYRGFKELKLDRLSRVNLIVGKNNVGKTSVLEALRLYWYPGSSPVLFELLESRDQIDPGVFYPRESRIRPLPAHYLFHIRPGQNYPNNPTIELQSEGSSDYRLSIVLTTSSIEFQSGHDTFILPISDMNRLSRIRASGEVLEGFDSTPTGQLAPCFFVSANGLGAARVEALWDAVALTSLEREVVSGLHLISPGIEGLVLKPVVEGSGVRVPFVKLAGLDTPVSLRSLGDGVNRLFATSLALANASDGVLLIDEAENGLHYSVQPQLWKLIFERARRLNVQVFATTHSYDCIKAFEEAARESEEEGLLIRLAQKDGRTFVAEFSEEELGIAVEGQIEVR
jgi:hypothetical protein